MIKGWLRVFKVTYSGTLQSVPIATQATVLSSGAAVLTFATPFALPVDRAVLDVAF